MSQLSKRRSLAASVLGFSIDVVTMRHCDLSSTSELKHDDEVMSLAFSSDGYSLVAGGEDCLVVLWDLVSKTKRTQVRVQGPISAVAFSNDGEYFVGGEEAGTITVWSAITFEEVGSKIIKQCRIFAVAMASKPDLVAVGGTATSVTLLQVPSMMTLASLQHDGHVRSLSFAPDGAMLAGGGGTDDMHGLLTKKDSSRHMKTVIWHTEDQADNCKYLGSIVFDDIVHAVAFSPSGKLLATGGEDSTVTIMMVERDFEKASELQSSAGVRCLGWSSQSRFLASGGEDMQVTVWDIMAERVIFQFPKAKDWYACTAFHPKKFVAGNVRFQQ
jgi:WD40 repeat protein